MAISVPVVVGLGLVSLLLYLSGTKGVVVISVLILLFMALIYFKQNALLYMPVVQGLPKSSSLNPRGYRHPSERNLQSTDLHLNTSDGVIIRGWHTKAKAEDRKRIIVYFHENAGNIGTRLGYVREIVKRTGSDVVMVAYRGYSDSQGQSTEEGLMRDSYAVMEYAISYSKQNNNLPIYVLGRSLGGAVTINLATQQLYKNEITGLILQNTFTSISDQIDYLLPILSYFKFLQRNHWPSITRIPSIKIPILFIKSVQDEIVPHEQMNRLHKAATSPKIMQYKIEYGTHNSSWDLQPEVYFKRFLEFFWRVEVGW